MNEELIQLQPLAERPVLLRIRPFNIIGQSPGKFTEGQWEQIMEYINPLL